MGGLDEHFFEAGGLDVFEFFELSRVLGDQFVESAKVESDLFLLSFVGNRDWEFSNIVQTQVRNSSFCLRAPNVLKKVSLDELVNEVAVGDLTSNPRHTLNKQGWQVPLFLSLIHI